MKNNTDTIMNAIRNFAEIDGEKIYNLIIALHEGTYEVSFRTGYLRYDCFVDAETHEVIGMSFEPLPYEIHEKVACF